MTSIVINMRDTTIIKPVILCSLNILENVVTGFFIKLDTVIIINKRYEKRIPMNLDKLAIKETTQLWLLFANQNCPRIDCALAVRSGSPVSCMYVVMCRLGPTGCNCCMS